MEMQTILTDLLTDTFLTLSLDYIFHFTQEKKRDDTLVSPSLFKKNK